MKNSVKKQNLLYFWIFCDFQSEKSFCNIQLSKYFHIQIFTYPNIQIFTDPNIQKFHLNYIKNNHNFPPVLNIVPPLDWSTDNLVHGRHTI